MTFNMTQNKWKIDDVLGVWPLHGLCGLWGGIAAGIFGLEMFGGLGGVSFLGQLTGSVLGISFAFILGFVTYKIINIFSPIRLSQEEEYNGADISIHKITATPNIDR